MEETAKKSYLWTYILTGILLVIGLIGLFRGDWISSGYVLGALGLLVWIYGSRRRKRGATRVGLFLAGIGVGILLYDMLKELIG